MEERGVDIEVQFAAGDFNFPISIQISKLEMSDPTDSEWIVVKTKDPKRSRLIG